MAHSLYQWARDERMLSPWFQWIDLSNKEYDKETLKELAFGGNVPIYDGRKISKTPWWVSDTAIMKLFVNNTGLFYTVFKLYAGRIFYCPLENMYRHDFPGISFDQCLKAIHFLHLDEIKPSAVAIQFTRSMTSIRTSSHIASKVLCFPEFMEFVSRCVDVACESDTAMMMARIKRMQNVTASGMIKCTVPDSRVFRAGDSLAVSFKNMKGNNPQSKAPSKSYQKLEDAIFDVRDAYLEGKETHANASFACTFEVLKYHLDSKDVQVLEEEREILPRMLVPILLDIFYDSIASDNGDVARIVFSLLIRYPVTFDSQKVLEPAAAGTCFMKMLYDYCDDDTNACKTALSVFSKILIGLPKTLVNCAYIELFLSHPVLRRGILRYILTRELTNVNYAEQRAQIALGLGQFGCYTPRALQIFLDKFQTDATFAHVYAWSMGQTAAGLKILGEICKAGDAQPPCKRKVACEALSSCSKSESDHISIDVVSSQSVTLRSTCSIDGASLHDVEMNRLGDTKVNISLDYQRIVSYLAQASSDTEMYFEVATKEVSSNTVFRVESLACAAFLDKNPDIAAFALHGLGQVFENDAKGVPDVISHDILRKLSQSIKLVNVNVRREAIYALGQIPLHLATSSQVHDISRVVVQLLSSAPWKTIYYSITALGHLGCLNEQSASYCSAQIRAMIPKFGHKVCGIALAKLGKNGKRHLLEVVRDPCVSSKTLTIAIVGLGLCGDGDEEILEELVRLATNGLAPTNRKEALVALSGMRRSCAVRWNSILSRSLDDPCLEVRKTSAMILANMDSHGELILIEMLQSTSSERMVESVIYGLGIIGPSCVKSLVGLAMGCGEVAKRAVYVLCKFKLHEVLEYLSTQDKSQQDSILSGLTRLSILIMSSSSWETLFVS